jgi:uncharacterized cupin superfamily protein
MVAQAQLAQTPHGVVPCGEGWFVVNACEAAWGADAFGRFCSFEPKDARFPQLGINIAVLDPGQPNGMYHGDCDQEDFLVLAGECLLLVESHKRQLRAWDFVHCPAGTEHIFVGAGDGPCTILMVGARSHADGPRIRYPVNDLALRHAAGVQTETDDPQQAYAGLAAPQPSRYRERDLPGRSSSRPTAPGPSPT